MTSWIISISTITILTSILTTLLPENEKFGIVKFIFSIVIILVVIKPTITDGEIDFIFEKSSETHIEVQQEFLDYYSNEKLEYIKNDCNIICNEEGILNAEITLKYSDNMNNQTLEKIIINLKNSGANNNIISEKEKNNVINKIKEKYNVKVEFIYEWNN